MTITKRHLLLFALGLFFLFAVGGTVSALSLHEALDDEGDVLSQHVQCSFSHSERDEWCRLVEYNAGCSGVGECLATVPLSHADLGTTVTWSSSCEVEAAMVLTDRSLDELREVVFDCSSSRDEEREDGHGTQIDEVESHDSDPLHDDDDRLTETIDEEVRDEGPLRQVFRCDFRGSDSPEWCAETRYRLSCSGVGSCEVELEFPYEDLGSTVTWSSSCGAEVSAVLTEEHLGDTYRLSFDCDRDEVHEETLRTEPVVAEDEDRSQPQHVDEEEREISETAEADENTLIERLRVLEEEERVSARYRERLERAIEDGQVTHDRLRESLDEVNGDAVDDRVDSLEERLDTALDAELRFTHLERRLRETGRVDSGELEADGIFLEDPRTVDGDRVDQGLSVESIVPTVVDTDGVGEPDEIVFSGRSAPDEVVLLFIYSEPIVVSVQADGDGRWEYRFREELPDGEHEIFIARVDARGSIQARSQSFSFIKEAAAIEFTPGPVSTVNGASDFPLMTLIVVVGAVLTISVLITLAIIGGRAHRTYR